MRTKPMTGPVYFALSVLAAAGLVLTVASCAGHITPLGPDAAVSKRPVAARLRQVLAPQPIVLRSPLVLEAMRVHASAPAGGCPAGYATLLGDNPGQCYRKIGTPMTITSAGVSSVSLLPKPTGQNAGPATYGFTITLSSAFEVQLLTAVTTTAYQAHGSLAISVAGRTWALPFVDQPFTSPQFQVPLPRSQALQLHRRLVPSG